MFQLAGGCSCTQRILFMQQKLQCMDAFVPVTLITQYQRLIKNKSFEYIYMSPFDKRSDLVYQCDSFIIFLYPGIILQFHQLYIQPIHRIHFRSKQVFGFFKEFSRFRIILMMHIITNIPGLAIHHYISPIIHSLGLLRQHFFQQALHFL